LLEKTFRNNILLYSYLFNSTLDLQIDL